MAQRNRTTAAAKVSSIERSSFHVVYRAFRKRMAELGCVICPECYVYVWPTHRHGAQSDREAA